MEVPSLTWVYSFFLTCTELPCVYLNFSQYDPKFGDAFWNSSKYSMVSYLLRMMTSWALVCNVWYLPAMHQKVRLLRADVTSVEFSTTTPYLSVMPRIG